MNRNDLFGRTSKQAAQVPVTPRPAASASLVLVQEPSPTVRMDDQKLQDELRNAMKAAGLEQEDPMTPLVTAFAHSIQFMADRGRTSDGVVALASERIHAALVEARHTADAEVKRINAAVRATETEVIQRMADSLAVNAQKALTRRVKVFDRNSALWAAAVLFGVATVCLFGGYVWGGNVAWADIRNTEVSLQAAFGNNPRGARDWLQLMTWNDPTASWDACYEEPRRIIASQGRRACFMLFWIEKAPSAKFEQQ